MSTNSERLKIHALSVLLEEILTLVFCFFFLNRQVNFEKEITLADVMSTHISKGPLELGVAQRLCMEDQVGACNEERSSKEFCVACKL